MDLSAILSDPKYHDLLSIVKGFRNGAVYGAKVRFPHALVMTYLFKEGSHREKWRGILKATFRHSKNLSFFVAIYKSLLLLQRKLHGGKESSADPFFAGLIGGYVIFGDDNPINQQIVLYLFSRVAMGLVKYSADNGIIPQPKFKSFPIFAALVWGAVMWLFRNNKKSLQPSLQASMQYLYNDSESWSSLRTLLWHNK